MFLTRIFTAVIGIPFICVCVYYGNILFRVMMLVISVLCVLEYLLLMSKKYNPYIIISLIMMIAFFILMCFFKNFSADKVGIYSIIMIFILFGTELFNKNPDLCMNRILSSFFGAFFIPLTLVYMIYIRDLNNGMEFVFFIFIVTWILDTAAYIFGKIFGKHKLAMSISPMKTIEGAIMGIIFAVLTSTICRNMFMSNILTLKNAVLLGIVISIVGQSSDLAESLIKRDVNVKDSGRIIPGHGGFFDRFDSYIFVAPIVYHILKFLK